MEISQVEENSIENLSKPIPNEEVSFIKKLDGIYDTSIGMVSCVGFMHIFGCLGFIQVLYGRLSWSSIIFAALLAEAAMLGQTMGAHRYWSHRSYKAKTPLRIFLGVSYAFSGLKSIWTYSAIHRVHHKFVDTENDPHNINEGLFHAHIGWLAKYDHKKLLRNLERIDMSDLESDPIVMFHHEYHFVIHSLLVWIIPTFVPWYFFGDTFFSSLCLSSLRALLVLHRSFLINSGAHYWGYRPYDASINPTDTKIFSLLAHGEGWHNYHHTFPWDYKAAEMGPYCWNISTAFIDFFAWIGWAYDLKSVSKDVIMKRVERTGNPSHLQNGPWGWGDMDISSEARLQTENLFPRKKC